MKTKKTADETGLVAELSQCALHDLLADILALFRLLLHTKEITIRLGKL